ncbi:hypothetical protein KEM52_000941 [Ascosphaera acerosa]|nr:hypothetical protein KEM52_000941 [Ascosphaera acerosa]
MKSFSCPFCPFAHTDPSTLVQHINGYHVQLPSEEKKEREREREKEKQQKSPSQSQRDERGQSSSTSYVSKFNSLLYANPSKAPESKESAGDGDDHAPRALVRSATADREQHQHRPRPSRRRTTHDYDHDHDRDRDREVQRVPTDVATPGFIFKGFLNAWRQSLSGPPGSRGRGASAADPDSPVRDDDHASDRRLVKHARRSASASSRRCLQDMASRHLVPACGHPCVPDRRV